MKFIKQFFDPDKDYFSLLHKEHEFQSLTESNKEGSSYRKGIYLTNVREDSDGVHFKLLRCSTNLSGPTDNFRETDLEIIEKVNAAAQEYFPGSPPLNHVLAQVYHNSIVNEKQKKARISAHSDKTKDMAENGLFAFCTFYDQYTEDEMKLSKLRFKLKDCVDKETFEGKERFDIVLYPNSMFIMSLAENRLYTHEIIPGALTVDKLPTRLGYVVRCSNTDAVFKDGKTYIKQHADGKLEELRKPVPDDLKLLKQLYYKENMSDELVIYPDTFFSLNQGDYTCPKV